MTTNTTNEIEQCVLILEDLRDELGKEIKYNKRICCGNMDALNLFPVLWECLRSSSPLIATSLNIRLSYETKQNSMLHPSKDVVAAINKVDKLFQVNCNEAAEARRAVLQMHEGLCRLIGLLRGA